MFTFSFAIKTDAATAMGATHSYTTKIVPIDVPKNCIKYAEEVLKSVDPTVKILPNTALLVGKNLHKMERKEPGSRMRAIAEAYYKTFY